MSERLLELKSVFPQLSNGTLNALEEIGRFHTLNPQEVLYYHGDMARSFYVVLEGAVRLVEYTHEGKTVNLKIYGRGDVFGLLAISGEYPHPSEINMITHTTIAAFDGEESRQLMMRHPEFALHIMDLLVSHVHHAHDRLRQMAAERVDQRLARTLIHLAEKFGNETADCISIDLPISQQEIAEFTGSTVETVNRVLGQWEKQGIIQRSRQHVDILDCAGLYEAMR